MKVEKGLKLKMSKIMSDNDNYNYEVYVYRVYKNKCRIKVTKSDCNLIGPGSEIGFYISGLQNRIDNKDYCEVIGNIYEDKHLIREK